MPKRIVTGDASATCAGVSMFTHVDTKPINHVEWMGRDGLSHYLEAVFGCREFVWNDTGNDTYHRFDVSDRSAFTDPGVLGASTRKAYAHAKKHGYVPDYGMRDLLLGLIAEGHLPAGDYLIHVSW